MDEMHDTKTTQTVAPGLMLHEDVAPDSLIEANDRMLAAAREEQLKRPAVGLKVSLEAELLKEFANHSVYSRKVHRLLNSSKMGSEKDSGEADDNLDDTFTELEKEQPNSGCPVSNGKGKQQVLTRKVRGDGSCFYRSFMFGLFEWLSANRKYFNRMEITLKEARRKALDVGYNDFVVDDFFEEFLDALNKVKSESWDVEDIRIKMNEDRDSFDKYTVMLSRLLAAVHFKSNVERYLPFIAPYISVEAFCKEEVEPMSKEAEQLQITALASMLKVRVRIVYLDPSSNTVDLPVFILPDDNDDDADHDGDTHHPIVVSLLYRPGHYDLFYLQQQQQ